MSMAKRTLVVVFIFGYNRISIYFIFPLCVAVPLHLSPPPLYTSMPTTRGRYFYHHECSSQSYFSFFNTPSSREICEIRAGCEGARTPPQLCPWQGQYARMMCAKGIGKEGKVEKRGVSFSRPRTCCLSKLNILFLPAWLSACMYVCACMSRCVHISLCLCVLSLSFLL